jgi:hypothetical protein
MKRLLLCAALLTIAAPTLAAERIPAQYRGNWCDPKQSGPFYRCRKLNSEAARWVEARGYAGSEETCNFLTITAVRGGHKVRAVCRSIEGGEGEPVVERWRLSPNGRRLKVEGDKGRK